MTLETLYFLTQIVAALAMVASLTFVGLQMRQQIREQRISRATERGRMIMDLNRDLTADSETRAVILKTFHAPGDLTPDEIFIAEAYWRSAIQIHLITYAEIKSGYVDDEVQISGRVRLLRGMAFDRWWNHMKPSYGEGFQAYFESIIAAGEAERQMEVEAREACNDD